jgi:hypothetical protein
MRKEEHGRYSEMSLDEPEPITPLIPSPHLSDRSLRTPSRKLNYFLVYHQTKFVFKAECFLVTSLSCKSIHQLANVTQVNLLNNLPI